MISDAQHDFSNGVVYNLFLDGDYGLQALEEICLNLLPLSCKLLDLFLVSNPYDVGGFHQIVVPWSDHDMIFFPAVLKDCVWLRSTRI
jgi:hypothetical protein